MTDWKDIEQLQLDLKRAQESTTVQKLSERNCIEILLKLQEMKLLDVIHTMDGKEYLTPSQLTQEIKNELYIHGGLVSLVELQSLLNIDFSYIESKANEIASSSNSIFLVLGKLLDKAYLDNIAEEINDTLQSIGQVKIADLCKSYDLPGEFLIAELVNRLGTIIDGRLDENNKDAIFTEAFISRHKCKIRGILTAISRPTSLQPILGECKMSSKLFYAIIDELLAENRIHGDFVGKRSDKSTFLPEMYVKTQNQCIDNFYQQNGYLEYDMLTKMGIGDAKSYIRRRFNDTISLNTVCVGSTIVSLIAATVDETLSTNSWVDVQPILPSPFTDADSTQLLQHVLKDHKSDKKEIGLVVDSIFASVAFEEKCKSLFDPILKERAEIAAKDATVFALTEEEMELYSFQMSGRKQPDAKETVEKSNIVPDSGRKKREKGSGGSGIGGREVKTRGKDKKRLKKQRELEASLGEAESIKKHTTSSEIEFMNVSELTQFLTDSVEGHCPEALLETIAIRLHRPLTKTFQEMSKSVFQFTISQKKNKKGNQEHSDAPVVSSSNKKSRKAYEEEINTLLANINLFVAAFEYFGDEISILLRRNLLHTLCTDLVNALFNMIGTEYLTGLDEKSQITPEIRIKILTRLPEEYHTPLKTLHQALTGKSLEDFNSALIKACSNDVCDVLLKKLDKKRERQILHGYKMSLMQQLEQDKDPATSLHLAVAIIFQSLTGKMLHIPGKCVPHIILFLRSHITQAAYENLTDFQAIVIQSLDGSVSQSDIEIELSKLRELVVNTKRKPTEQ
uniref:E3 UFM1-protein ligase 1-like n=1 Tax=Styela clava TaxID=7725 RepID=UPI00193A23AE|nr:E3 UFM1-protein ligase 1-like [Styela clava]